MGMHLGSAAAEERRVKLSSTEIRTIAPIDIARIYSAGSAIDDEDIHRLQERGNGAAWFACVEPAERERLLREDAEAEAKRQAAPTIRAEYPRPKASSGKSAALAVAKKLLPHIGELIETCNELSKRVEALEARGTVSYEGIWTSQRSYSKGDLVTYSGSMWACRAASGTTAAKPGASVDWQLCVKAGRDCRPDPHGRRNDGDER